MVYQWKSGTRIKGDAQKSGELFEQLAATEEGLTAKTLLEANKIETAPLHNDYEWNNETAANEWRLHQSRKFINSLVIVEVAPTLNIPETSRAFQITTEPHKYEPLTTIITVEEKYETLLSKAFAELKAFQRKYSMLEELAPIFTTISTIEEEINEQINNHGSLDCSA